MVDGSIVMEVIPDKRKLVSLVEQAYDGRLCLPNFQRDFVWPRDQVADLVRSVLRGFYIGSLLLLRCNPNNPPFAPVHLKGSRPPHVDPRPELLVLDGQQRLSAMLYALTAPDHSLADSTQRRWFFVNLDMLLSEMDNDEIVFDRTRRELDGLDQVENQYKQRMLPCTVLLRSEAFMKWRDGLDDWLRDNDSENHQKFRTEWRDKWTTLITQFQTFPVTLNELPLVDENDKAAIGRVCAIFEKLNSTGMELSVYDLLTARLYRSNIRLHDLWKQACRDNERLNKWSKGKAETNKFGVLLLRTLALLRGIDPKPRNLINLEPESFPEDWARAAKAMERAIELVNLVGEDGFGAFNERWIPGYGLLPVLAALREEIVSQRLGEGPRIDLRRWYWCNVFLERYSSAVESKSRKDYLELTSRWKSGGGEPEVFKEALTLIGAPGYSVRDSASRSSSIYSGIFCILAIDGARDWRRGESIQLQELQDHHIFPRAFLLDHGMSKKGLMNTIVNRTLISDETNNKIKASAPADYVVNTTIFPSGLEEQTLSPHFIDSTAFGHMKEAKDALTNEELSQVYMKFLNAREAAILSRIRALCGIPSPSNS